MKLQELPPLGGQLDGGIFTGLTTQKDGTHHPGAPRMSHPNYVFHLCLRVDDPQALYQAALRKLTVIDGLSGPEAVDLIGEPNTPKIEDCIIECLDPGSLAGCSIDTSGVEEA